MDWLRVREVELKKLKGWIKFPLAPSLYRSPSERRTPSPYCLVRGQGSEGRSGGALGQEKKPPVLPEAWRLLSVRGGYFDKGRERHLAIRQIGRPQVHLLAVLPLKHQSRDRASSGL